MSNAESVKQFTEAARNIACPNIPQPLSKKDVRFIIRMVMSEMQELAATVCETKMESVQMMQSCLSEIDVSEIPKPPLTPSGLVDIREERMEQIANQADAMVDSWYYMLDIAAKHGINLSKVFDVVHQANMDKRSQDGLFHRREDGKILKPIDWQPPNITAEIKRQTTKGSWPSFY